MLLTQTNTERSGPEQNPFHDSFETLANHLRHQGLSKSGIRQLRPSVNHFLVWIEQQGIPIRIIDDSVLRRFRRHDCRCPGMERERQKMLSTEKRGFMTGALKLVQFLEDSGRIEHPGELDVGLNLLDAFIGQCATQGYVPDTLVRYRSSCRHMLVWLHRSRIQIADVSQETVECFLDHDCVCPGPFESPRKRLSGVRYVFPIMAFLRHLSEDGILAAPILQPVTEPDPAMEQFGEWLRKHRGIADKTIRKHVGRARSLVADLGQDPDRYDASRIREVLLNRFSKASWHHARSLATSMRMYLRFLCANGTCEPKLISAVPTAPIWRLANLPRYASADVIEQVIAHCNVATHVGLRDRAILLLLARLALRAGDIVQLRLGDIDWRNALIRVCGKSQRQVGLPLPQDAGDAVLAYIEHARPRVPEDRVFLRSRPPYRPFASSNSITSLVIYALRRAGMDEVRPQGAYLFRHSAATRMLRCGASLDVVSALLRHRSMDTTVIYAKTDRPMLLEIAQPWIGDRA